MKKFLFDLFKYFLITFAFIAGCMLFILGSIMFIGWCLPNGVNTSGFFTGLRIIVYMSLLVGVVGAIANIGQKNYVGSTDDVDDRDFW